VLLDTLVRDCRYSWACRAASAEAGRANGLPLVAADAGDISPIEHLRHIRRVFIDSDNLLGPVHIIPAVQGYINLIQRLRSGRQGADRRANGIAFR
jgi:hypothetical protein